MKDAYSYYIEPFENFDQVIAWESPGSTGRVNACDGWGMAGLASEIPANV